MPSRNPTRNRREAERSGLLPGWIYGLYILLSCGSTSSCHMVLHRRSERRANVKSGQFTGTSQTCETHPNAEQQDKCQSLPQSLTPAQTISRKLCSSRFPSNLSNEFTLYRLRLHCICIIPRFGFCFGDNGGYFDDLQ
jgi:hypothetical protein